MDKYLKLSLGIVIGVFSIAFIYNIILYLGDGGLSLADLSFPFYIFFPGWVAIFIPLIVRQRQEEKNKEEELRNSLEVWKVRF